MLSKYEKTAPLFLFSEGQIYKKSISLFSFLCCNFVETIFKMILSTLVAKYKDILTFNFAHTFNPKWLIKPLLSDGKIFFSYKQAKLNLKLYKCIFYFLSELEHHTLILPVNHIVIFGTPSKIQV